jgi:hypothetical protein
MTVQTHLQDTRQDTRQALKLIARLMRQTPESAAQFVMAAGLDEHQTRMVAGLIADNPFFNYSKPKPKPAKAKCPECGQWFTYNRVTRYKKWCSEACRMKAKRRQFEKVLEQKRIDAEKEKQRRIAIGEERMRRGLPAVVAIKPFSLKG